MKTYEIKDFLEVKSSSSTSISPDGTFVSYLSNLTGTQQLYIIPTAGGNAEQITSFEDPVSFATFSPVKNEIMFGKAEGGNEQTQFFLYSLDTKQTRMFTHKPHVRYNFGQWSRDGKYISYAHNERNGKDFDVCIMDVETGVSETVFSEGGSCYPSGFSPKGTYLAIRKYYSNVSDDIYLLNRNDKSVKLITTHRVDESFFGGALWLHDESGFYATSNHDRDFTGLSHYSVEKNVFTDVLNPSRDIDSVSLSKDNAFLATIVNEDGYNKLNFFNLPDFSPVTLTDLPKTGMIYGVRISNDSKFIVLNVGDSRHATDVWIYSITEQKCRQLTKSPQGVPPEALVEPGLFRFTSFDGLQVPAFLYLPKNATAESKVPVIINIHGGPESQYTPSLALLTQYFVYHGYAVIAPNVRGSSGYGKKYLALDDVEKRLDSVKDLEYLHKHIEKQPQLDSKKVVLMGGSYGGYMTLAGLAFYPDLWIGGIDIVGIANFITFLENTAPYRRHLRETEYGSLEKHRDLLYAISPINHIDKIKAPLLVIHGANDPRVPLNEAEQIVSKLTTVGKHAELLVYADEGHGLSKLKNRLDAYPKVVAFLDKIINKTIE